MRSIRALAFVLAVMAALPSVARAGEPGRAGDPVARVTELEATRRAAMVAGDIKTLSGLLAPDATYIHSNGRRQTRDELFAMLTGGEVRYVAITVDAVEYRSYGRAVVGTGVQTLDLESAGKAFVSRSCFTVVYAPVEGEMRMVAYQSTPVPEAAPAGKP